MFFDAGVIISGKTNFILTDNGFMIGDEGIFDIFLTEQGLSIQNAGNEAWSLRGGGLNGGCRTYIKGLGFPIDVDLSFLNKLPVQYRFDGKGPSNIGCVAVPIFEDNYMFYQVGPKIKGREDDPEIFRELILSNYSFFKCISDERLGDWNKRVVYSGVSNAIWGGTLKDVKFNEVSIIDYINVLCLTSLTNATGFHSEIFLGKGLSDAIIQIQKDEKGVIDFIKSKTDEKIYVQYIKPLVNPRITLDFFHSLEKEADRPDFMDISKPEVASSSKSAQSLDLSEESKEVPDQQIAAESEILKKSKVEELKSKELKIDKTPSI